MCVTSCGDEKTLMTRSGLRDVLAEFVAMVLFVYFGCGSALATGDSLSQQTIPETVQSSRITPIALSFGMSILVLVFSIGHISGGHINPAVTLTLIVSGNCAPLRGFFYMLAQFLGAIIGASLLWGSTNQMSYGTEPDLDNPNITYNRIDKIGNPPFLLGANGLNKTLSVGNGFLLELMGTLLLCLCVLSTVTHPKSMALGKPCVAPIPIGFAVFVAHVVLIPFTGCGINPARTFGPYIVCLMSGINPFSDQWIYYIGPFLASCIAALIHHFIFLVPDAETDASVEEQADQQQQQQQADQSDTSLGKV